VSVLPIYRIAIRGSELEETILPLLRGSVFHVTSSTALHEIITAGFVHSNADGRHAFTKPQSQKSYGRCHGMPCLFDLRHVSSDTLRDALTKLYFIDLFRGRTVFLILRREAEPMLRLPPKSMAAVDYKYLWIPDVEVFYPTDLPVEQLELALDVSTTRGRSPAAIVQLRRLQAKMSRR
jgi:hypothetical protein